MGNFRVGEKVQVRKTGDPHYGHIGILRKIGEDGMMKIGDLPGDGNTVSRVGRSYRARNIEAVSETEEEV